MVYLASNMGFGKVKIDKNDAIFSKMIRERDGRCVLCGDTERKSECSHFWGRLDKVHRFDPLNCEYLCFSCHIKVEGNKQGVYRNYKLKQLGKKLYDKMEQDHYRLTKKYGEYEKKLLYEILKEQYKNKDYLKPDWKVIW